MPTLKPLASKLSQRPQWPRPENSSSTLPTRAETILNASGTNENQSQAANPSRLTPSHVIDDLQMACSDQRFLRNQDSFIVDNFAHHVYNTDADNDIKVKSGLLVLYSLVLAPILAPLNMVGRLGFTVYHLFRGSPKEALTQFLKFIGTPIFLLGMIGGSVLGTIKPHLGRALFALAEKHFAIGDSYAAVCFQPLVRHYPLSPYEENKLRYLDRSRHTFGGVNSPIGRL